MRFATIFAICSASTVFAAAIEKRTAAQILNDITAIKNNANIVYNDIITYNKTTSGAVKIYEDSNTLTAAIQNATTDAQNTSPLSSSDSVAISNSIVTLQPQIFKTLDALVAQKYGFTAATLGFDATGLVQNSLVQQRQNTQYLSGNLTNILVPVLAKNAPLLTSNIDYHLVRALQAFNGLAG